MSESVQANYLIQYEGPRVSRDCFHAVSDFFLSTMRLACGETITVSKNLEFTSQKQLSTIRRLFLVIVVCVTTVPFVLIGLVFQILSPSRRALYQHYLLYQEHAHLCNSNETEILHLFTEKEKTPEAWRDQFRFCCQMSFRNPSTDEKDFSQVLAKLSKEYSQDKLKNLLLSVDPSSLTTSFLAQIALFAERHSVSSLKPAQDELLKRYSSGQLTHLSDQDLRYVLGGLPKDQWLSALILETAIDKLRINSANRLFILWDEIFRFREKELAHLPDDFFSTLVQMFFERSYLFNREEDKNKLRDLMKLPSIGRLNSIQLAFLIAYAKKMDLHNIFDLLAIIKGTGCKEKVPESLTKLSLVTWPILHDFINAYPDTSLQDLAEFFLQLGDEADSYGTIFGKLPEDLKERIRTAHRLKGSKQG